MLDLLDRQGLRALAVTITGGDAVQTMEASFESPSGTLLNFKAKISVSGHDSYEAWRESVHDFGLPSWAIRLRM